MADRFFLCCGIPKSGTTFLQRMLGMHPSVSCPSEQSFEPILRHVEAFVNEYNPLVQAIDRRTGGQGAQTIGGAIGQALLRDFILSLSRGFAGDRPVHGLNENSVFFDLAFYDDLFGNPPIICIFRNPVDRAISTWTHNHRLAREEKDMAAAHLALLENPEGTLEGYVKLQVENFGQVVDRFRAYAENRPNILAVHYEKLVADKMSELKRLFDFLQVDSAPALLETIVNESSPEAMAAHSAVPAFFGVGEKSGQRSGFRPEIRAELISACTAQMERIG